MTSVEQHAAVLDALDERIRIATTGLPFVPFGGTPVRDTTVDELAGRRRILERHAPVEYRGTPVGDCLANHSDPPPWPCDDYRDAAVGLGVDLGEVQL